jgi:hypothetical protein
MTVAAVNTSVAFWFQPKAAGGASLSLFVGHDQYTRPFMRITIKAIKRGVKAALSGPKPERFQAGGKIIACSHCGGESFAPRDLSRLASEGLLREHYGLECSTCYHLELFTKKPAEIESGV